jgi:predicted dehydrogenase
VLCEKPMTMTVEEGEEIVRVAQGSGRICAVNYCYSAYPMVRQMRQMVRTGELGKVRLVVTNFSHGHHGDATDADNPRVRWRYDPAHGGRVGAVCRLRHPRAAYGQFHLGDQVDKLSADFASTIESRVLEDDAMVNFRTVARHGRAALDLIGGHRAPAWVRHSGLWRNRRPALGVGAAQPGYLHARGRAHADHGEGRSGPER